MFGPKKTIKGDFIFGVCETGQGEFNGVMQYPDVFCGL
jgi:hypothetical protein